MTLHLRHFGQGPRPALLIHCQLGHGGGWGGLMTRLDDLVTATAPDLPGHGRSPAWDGVGDYHDACTAALVPFLSGRPAVLIGHSFGATLALRLALERPERVSHLVLIDPVLFAAAGLGPGRRAHDAAFAAVHAGLARGDLRAAARAFLAIWGDGTPFDDLPPPVQARMAEGMPLVAAASPALDADRAGLLAPGRPEALALPVLLITAALSPPVMGEIGATLAARLPCATWQQIAGAGHMLPITDPDSVASRLRAFLA